MSKTIKFKVLRFLNSLAGAAESTVSPLVQSETLSHRPIFIIGAPRSGTTLLIQLLISRFELAYLTNVAAALYLSPTMAGLFSRLANRRRPKSDMYTSSYGRTDGYLGPSESPRFWYRWFPAGNQVYVAPNATPATVLCQLRRSVIRFSRTVKVPAIYKNTYNSMRIAPISEALPEAVFLVMKRNPVDTAQSILEARHSQGKGKEYWWSLPPKEIDSIRTLPYWEQVVEQVYCIEQQIAGDARRLGEERFLYVSYESLCSDTFETMELFERFMREHDTSLKIRGTVRNQFNISTGRKINRQDYALIEKAVAERWM